MPVKIGGKKISGWYLAGGAAGTGIVVYLVRRSGSSSAAGTTASDSSAIDPVTDLPYSEDDQTDPATGMTYLTEAEEYGSVAAAEAAVSGQYQAATGEDLSGLDSGYPTIYPGTATSATPGSYVTNAQWAQAVTQGLVGLGYSSTDVSAALGLYFQGLPLQPGSDGVSYLSIIQAAVAEFGPPPVGNYAIIAPPSSGGPTGTGGTGTGTGTGGGSPPAAKKEPAPTGLRITSKTSTSLAASWKAIPGYSGGYYVWATNGAREIGHSDVSGTSYQLSGLKPGGTYGVHVRASSPSDSPGAGTTITLPKS